MSKAFETIKAGLEDALTYAEGRADISKYVVHIPAVGGTKEVNSKPEHDQSNSEDSA